MMFKKVLIANRGEIAARVIRACREMGIIPVAVYSDVDSKAQHVRLAEEAYSLGGAKPSESYLNVEKVIGIAKACRADAVHPGYGFLAENPGFVRRCEEENLVFIGPPSESMGIMGHKVTSRVHMVKAGIPVIPGTLEPVKDERDLIERAGEVGFPLLLKASAGGGGKGLRLVKGKSGLLSAYRLACSEAESSFNDPSVYIEKYIEEPHHIEIQVLADHKGNIVHLGERECSIQRRYQKVLEETPSPFLDEKTRREMGRVAVQVAAAVNYKNAGTVEFMVDKKRNFYFLEMNTRLQVEHPVTEMVTGVDLVKCQIEIAAGKELPFQQEDIQPRGHSLQCRIYAEDPDHDFMPSPGRIVRLQTPSGGLGVRDDNGVYEGYVVPLEYDPLLSKLITWGSTRAEAIERMRRSLAEYKIYGIKTTIPFFRRILIHPRFVKGDYTTHFISTMEKERNGNDEEEKRVALIAAGIMSFAESRQGLTMRKKSAMSGWKFQGRLQNFANRL